MRIQLDNIKYYFLTVDTNSERKKHMIQEFKKYDLTEVLPVLGIDRVQSGVTGFSRMIDIALRNQDRSKPFQPFVLLEDDCSKYREFPDYIDIPDDADMCYIGLSKCSMNENSWHFGSYYKNINDDLIRIFNMLSAHGIIICSASAAIALQKSILECYYKNIIWDICLAQLQPYYNVYALKRPLVYQDGVFGGQEELTKFEINTDRDSPLPGRFLNKTNLSAMTCYGVSL